jgi:hypothetical protein
MTKQRIRLCQIRAMINQNETLILNTMRLILILLCAFHIGCRAQQPYPAGSYIKDPALDPYVGTWVYNSGNTTFTIVLQKQKVYYPAPLNYHMDNLVGWHKLVVNGVTVEDDLQDAGQPLSISNVNFSLLGSSKGNSVNFTTVKDITKNKEGAGSFSLHSGTPAQAQWVLTETKGLKPANFTWGFTLPTNVIMIKQ